MEMMTILRKQTKIKAGAGAGTQWQHTVYTALSSIPKGRRNMKEAWNGNEEKREGKKVGRPRCLNV